MRVRLPRRRRAGRDRCCLGHAPVEVVLDFEVEVGLEFFVEFLCASPAHPARESHQPSCLAGLRMRDTACTIVSHRLVSAVNRDRPARVIL